MLTLTATLVSIFLSSPTFAADKAAMVKAGLEEHTALNETCATNQKEIKKLYAKKMVEGKPAVIGDESLKQAMTLATGAKLGSPKIAAAQLALSEEKAPTKQDVIDLMTLNSEPLKCYGLYEEPLRATVKGLSLSSNESLKKEAKAQLKDWATHESSITALGFMMRTAALNNAIESGLLKATDEEKKELKKIRDDMKAEIAPYTLKLNEAIRAATVDKNAKPARPELTANSNFDPLKLRELLLQERVMVRKHNDALKPWITRVSVK